MVDLSYIHTFINGLSKKERNLFYVSVVVVSLAVLMRLVISPAADKMSSLNREAEETKMTIAKDLRFLSYKARINLLASKYASYFTEADSPEEEKNSLIKLIEGFAASASVSLINRAASFKSEAGESKYVINLTCKGDMPAIVSFLYQIESSNKLFDVEKFIISPESEATGLAQCRLTISRMGSFNQPQ